MVRARVVFATALSFACFAFVPHPASADGKVSLYLSRMEPADVDASRFSTASWGGGIDAVWPWSGAHNLIALDGGFEITNMLSESTDIYDPIIRAVLLQSTNQSYGRFYLGARVGPHGPGFIRPHVGANVAVVWYDISTNIEIPNPSDPSNPTTRTLDSKTNGAFGYDLNAGVDLNLANKFPIELGARYLQSFEVPQQLGEGAVSISPSYYQIYFAVGMGFDFIGRIGKKPHTAP
jgi:opacity protein-like surface antigen